MLLFRRSLTTASRDYEALSQSYQLTEKVARSLQRDRQIPFESMLNSFRSNADGFFSSNKQKVHNMGMILSHKAIIISVDTGGESTVTDVGFCIYDKARNSIYKIQLDIKGRKLAKKSGVINNLFATPVKLDLLEAEQFIKRLFRYYFFDQSVLMGHDVCIIGHNLERDLKSLTMLNINVPNEIEKIDTDILCRQSLFPKGLNLRKLALALEIEETKPFHPSVNDAYYTLQVLFRIVSSTKFQELPFTQLKSCHESYKEKLHRHMDEYEARNKIRRLIMAMSGTTDENTINHVIRLISKRSKRTKDLDPSRIRPTIEKAVRRANMMNSINLSQVLAPSPQISTTLASYS
jgi:hypothetical protein